MAVPLFIQSLLYLYLSQYLPDRCRNRQLRTNFSGCCTLIDHHQMFSSEIINKSCCRINDQGRTTYDQRICFTYCLHTLIDHSRIKTFLIKYNIRFDHSTAAASRDSVCMFYIKPHRRIYGISCSNCDEYFRAIPVHFCFLPPDEVRQYSA